MGRRKATEQEKNDKKQKKVDDFAPIDKEGQLTVFTEKKTLQISQEVIDKFDIKPVGKPAKLSGMKINGFNGKNYEASLNEAYEWAKSNNENDKILDKIVLVDYYPQSFMSRSVLVSYNTKPKKIKQENENE